MIGFAMNRMLTMLAVVVLLGPAPSFAQSGDAEAGQAKSATCVACHGQTGISVSPAFPHLAGQVPGFIAAQLKLFQKGADGGRENAVMAGFVEGLSEQDMLDIDAFYSVQTPASGSITPEQEALALAGRPIYRAGHAEYSIPSCMGCHGPAGKGIGPHYPRLSGQPAEYIRTQLIAYKNGERENHIMNDVAFPLSMEQIDALATYISGLN